MIPEGVAFGFLNQGSKESADSNSKEGGMDDSEIKRIGAAGARKGDRVAQQRPGSGGYVPPAVVFPEKKSLWKQSRFLIIVFFLLCFVGPWIWILFGWIAGGGDSGDGFFRLKPEIREWAGTYCVVVLFAMVIGTAIRLLRKI